VITIAKKKKSNKNKVGSKNNPIDIYVTNEKLKPNAYTHKQDKNYIMLHTGNKNAIKKIRKINKSLE